MHGVQALSAPAMLGPSVRPLQVPLDLPLYVPQHNSRSCWLEAGWARDAAEERQARRPVAGSAGLRLRGGSQRDWLPPALAKLPVITRSIILFNLAIFLLGVAAPDHPIVGGKSAIRTLGFAPQELLQPGTITPAELGKHAARFVGHAFTHASLLHVAFNMLSLSSIGASLEFLIGSSSFLFLVGKMLLATPLVIIAAEVFLRFTSGPPLIPGSMVGFSGVLFALITIEALSAPPGRVRAPALLGDWTLWGEENRENRGLLSPTTTTILPTAAVRSPRAAWPSTPVSCPSAPAAGRGLRARLRAAG